MAADLFTLHWLLLAAAFAVAAMVLAVRHHRQQREARHVLS